MTTSSEKIKCLLIVQEGSLLTQQGNLLPAQGNDPLLGEEEHLLLVHELNLYSSIANLNKNDVTYFISRTGAYELCI